MSLDAYAIVMMLLGIGGFSLALAALIVACFKK